MNPDDITESSAINIVAAVRSRRTTASAVTRAFLDRTERLEPVLNTYVTLMPEYALESARLVDQRISEGLNPGLLAGLPISVKDLIAVGRERQTFGSRLWRNNVANDDAPSVDRLRAAGACIVGKTTTSELGSKAVGDSPLTGVTRNPWNHNQTPGGSSAGAAAGVAARLVPVALGTDGGGSIRIPAAFCGLVGLKASFGRVPVWPPSATPSVAHVCPIGRSVEDVALILSVISGHDARDPGAIRETAIDPFVSLHEGVHGLRVGWAPTLGYGHVAAEILTVCATATARLGMEGAHVVPMPALFEQDPSPAWNTVFYGAIAQRLHQVGNWAEIEAEIDPALRDTIVSQQLLSMASVDLMRDRVRARIDALFSKVDIIALPTVPITAPPINVDVPEGHEGRNPVDWSYFTYPFNLSGNPAISVPVGLDASGMPIGLQLVAPRGADLTLIRAAAALERVHPFSNRPYKS